MKKLLLTLALILLATTSNAQCVGVVKDVLQDDIRGSIIVETEYTLNGKVVQLGRTRYTETSGTNLEIIARAKLDIAEHCKNLVRRIEVNETYRKAEVLKINKALTLPIITDIKPALVGYSSSVTEVVDTYKGKDIKVTYDEKNTSSFTAVAVTK